MRIAWIAFAALAGCGVIPGTRTSLIDETGISTTLADAYPECPWMDGAVLGRPEPIEDGTPVLRPGYYSVALTTY